MLHSLLMMSATLLMLSMMVAKQSRTLAARAVYPAMEQPAGQQVELTPVHGPQNAFQTPPPHIPRTRVHVVVTGDPEINQILTFTLYPFEEQFVYHIDYGDGYQQVARSRNRHLYSRPGNYKLSVTVLYGRDTVDYNQFNLHIHPSVSVTSHRPQPSSSPSSSMVMPRNEESVPQSPDEVQIIDQGNWNESQPASSIDQDEPLMAASVMPSFPGGDQALNRFLARNLKYPDAARNRGIEGKVVVQFVVERDGRLTNLQIIKGLGHGTEEAVMHTLARMPRWNPGEHLGELVRVHYTLPITFKLM